MKLFGKTISNQAIFTTMATVVSSCALVVSLMQTYYQHKYLHAAAWPHLQLESLREEMDDSSKNRMTIKILNKGVGPAIVESVEYKYKNKKVANLNELIFIIVGKKFLGSSQSIETGKVIAQNDEIIHVSFIGAANSKKFQNALPEIEMRVIYSSVHEQMWELIYSSKIEGGTKTNKLN
jgi:hypothetical protein